MVVVAVPRNIPVGMVVVLTDAAAAVEDEEEAVEVDVLPVVANLRDKLVIAIMITMSG
jgi:hypothetical protein